MRNLKKVLALALATVMLLGMMAMASAKDYADEKQITAKYDAAVDVMQSIGVFEGTTVGEETYLYPTNTLTRAEAAKVITFLALTKANAGKLGTAEAPFADVAADHWAAGSIAYAKNLGIVSGVGADNYDPAGKLTGYQFAKMLLVVLGYKADSEGFTGSGWSTNVDAAALSAGLKAGLDIDMGAYITREEAAQMAFNALKATCVAYEGGTILEVDGVKISVGGTRYKVGAVETATEGVYEGYVDGTNDAYQQLAEKLYPNLMVAKAVPTAFEYATNNWTNGTSTVIAAEPAYTVVKSWDGTAASVTSADLYALVGTAALPYYVNGERELDGEGAEKTIAATRGSTAKPFAAYAGSLVELIKIGTTKQIVITVGQPAKVTKVVDATASADRKVQVDVNFDALYDYEITTEKYAKGDYVIVYLVDDAATVATDDLKVGKHEAAETIYGTVTQIAKSTTTGKATTLYVDGAAVPVAGKDDCQVVDGKGAKNVVTLNKKYTVVMNNGYAVAAFQDAVAADLSSYVYVYTGGAIAGEYTGSDPSYEVKVINMDGTNATLKAEKNEFVEETEEGTQVLTASFGYAGSTFTGAGLYKVTDTDVDGKKEFAKMIDLGVASTTVPFAAFKQEITKANTDKSVVLTDGEASVKAFYTANTKVLTIATAASGAVTGSVAAVPAAAAYTDNGTTNYTYAIYSYNATAKAYEVVMVVTNTTDAVPSDNLYYVVNKEVGKVYVAEAAKTYGQYVAYEVATGEKKTVMVTAAPAGTGFYAVAKVNEYGAYTFGTETYANAADCTKATALTVYGTYMTVGGTAVADFDVTDVVIIDKTTAGIKTVADLTTKYAAVNAEGNTTGVLDFSVLWNAADREVVAIVVTAYTA